MKHRLLAIALLLVASPAFAQGPKTIDEAVAQIKRITDPDPAKQNELRAREALKITTDRMKVLNDVSGTIFQTLPVDVWNKFSETGNIKTRAEVMEFVRAKGWDLAQAAWVVQAGSCDEHASVMQLLLKRADVPVTILRSNSPHAFPVVNLPKDADPDVPWTWGSNALVVDSWIGRTLTPTQAWENKHCFNNGDRLVSVDRQSSREKLAEMSKRGEAFCEQHRAEYQRLFDLFMQIPSEYRDKLAFRPLQLKALKQGAVFVQVRDSDKHTYVSGATVVVTFPDKNEGLRTGTTDGNGKVMFESLPGGAGKYTLRVVKNGYKVSNTPFELLFEKSLTKLVDLEEANKPVMKIKLEWNTATDVDLWVIEPDGTKCYYNNKTTKNGSILHQDITTGFGPEHFTLTKAMAGTYTIKVHYYSGPRDKNTPFTIARVTVVQNPGTPKESTQHYSATLRARDDLVEITQVKFEKATP